MPDGRARSDREVLEEALGDAAELNVVVISGELAKDLDTIALGVAVHIKVGISRPLRIEEPDLWHHGMNRDLERRAIFIDEAP